MTMPPATTATGARESTEAALVDAACDCFERYGVRKTTMDDIAQQAGVSRATLYRYFSSKEAIVERIGALEAGKVTQELRGQLKKALSIEDTLVECLLLSTRIAHRNPRIRALTDFRATASRTADPASPGHQANRALWGGLIEEARSQGRLAEDISLDEIASWLVLAQALLLTKVEALDVSDRQLRHFIKRFIVSAVLPRVAGIP